MAKEELDIREEEALKLLWFKEEEGIELSETEPVEKHSIEEEDFKKLEKKKLAFKKNKEWFLTDKGKHLAADIVRRLRLAEWLFTEIISENEEKASADACRLEHILTKESSDSICTLLGHPQVCPHGKPIPKGKCCVEQRLKISPILVPLIHLKEGKKGKVVSINIEEKRAKHVLFSLGVMPGVEIKVFQKTPAFSVEIDGTRIAIDKKIAEHIFVKPLN
jgi:DtxR family Mn-dependent transcriptional regulator